MVKRLPVAQVYANRPGTLRLAWAGRQGDRSVEISKGSMITCSVVLALLMLWYLIATVYLIFRDDMLANVMRNNSDMQYTYEDRISSLRTHLDRVVTRQLVDQDTFEGRLDELMKRQAQLETRSAVLGTLTDQAARLGLTQGEPESTGSVGLVPGKRAVPARPTPDTIGTAKEQSIIGRQGAADPVIGSMIIGFAPLRSEAGLPTRASVAEQIGAVEESITLIDKSQKTALVRLDRAVNDGPARLKAVIEDIGLDTKRFAKPGSDADATGGPFVAMPEMQGPFGKTVARIQAGLQIGLQFSQALESLPLRRPMPVGVTITSGFGERTDPFQIGRASCRERVLMPV